jgi:hypothetical protein
MPPILTAQSVIMCAHGGQIRAIPEQMNVTIQGAPILCVPDLIGAPIVGCALPPTPATKPCTLVVETFPGSWSFKVTVGGRPAYVSTLVGLTDGVPPSPLIVVYPGQVTVEALG